VWLTGPRLVRAYGDLDMALGDVTRCAAEWPCVRVCAHSMLVGEAGWRGLDFWMDGRAGEWRREMVIGDLLMPRPGDGAGFLASILLGLLVSCSL